MRLRKVANKCRFPTVDWNWFWVGPAIGNRQSTIGNPTLIRYRVVVLTSSPGGSLPAQLLISGCACLRVHAGAAARIFGRSEVHLIGVDKVTLITIGIFGVDVVLAELHTKDASLTLDGVKNAPGSVVPHDDWGVFVQSHNVIR